MTVIRLVDVRTALPAPRPFSDPLPASDMLQIFIPEKIVSLPAVGEFRQVVNLFIDIPD